MMFIASAWKSDLMSIRNASFYENREIIHSLDNLKFGNRFGRTTFGGTTFGGNSKKLEILLG
jgi:hypothetical protein